MLIPYTLLSEDVLQNLIEDFVTREGTDNGDDTPLQTRVQRVQQALKKAEAVIAFDPDSQQCTLMLRQDAPTQWLQDLTEAMQDD